MHRAGERLRTEQAVTAGLYEQQRTMFQELQHRVANNMQFVAALLTLQKRKVGDDPKAALTASTRRGCAWRRSPASTAASTTRAASRPPWAST